MPKCFLMSLLYLSNILAEVLVRSGCWWIIRQADRPAADEQVCENMMIRYLLRPAVCSEQVKFVLNPQPLHLIKSGWVWLSVCTFGRVLAPEDQMWADSCSYVAARFDLGLGLKIWVDLGRKKKTNKIKSAPASRARASFGPEIALSRFELVLVHHS